MSTIGIQSTVNHVHANGLSGRVPYDVGRSIRMWQTTPSDEMTHRLRKAARVVRDGPVEQALAGDHQPGDDQAEPDDAERSVRRTAMPVRDISPRRRRS